MKKMKSLARRRGRAFPKATIGRDLALHRSAKRAEMSLPATLLSIFEVARRLDVSIPTLTFDLARRADFPQRYWLTQKFWNKGVPDDDLDVEVSIWYWDALEIDEWLERRNRAVIAVHERQLSRLKGEQ